MTGTGLEFSHPVDMWAVGCILTELYTGMPVFPTYVLLVLCALSVKGGTVLCRGRFIGMSLLSPVSDVTRIAV